MEALLELNKKIEAEEAKTKRRLQVRAEEEACKMEITKRLRARDEEKIRELEVELKTVCSAFPELEGIIDFDYRVDLKRERDEREAYYEWRLYELTKDRLCSLEYDTIIYRRKLHSRSGEELVDFLVHQLETLTYD